MISLKRCQNKNEWDEFTLDQAGHPLQLWGWGDLKAAHNWNVDRLFFYNDNDEPIGAVQLLIKKLPWPFRSLCYVPRGPAVGEADRVELLTALADYSKKNYHAVLLKVEPDCEVFAQDGWVKTDNYILPSRTIILDLNKSDAELMADMAKKTRQYIRKSASENMVIQPVKSRQELAQCLAIYHQTAARAGFDLHDDQYYYDVFDKLGEFSLLLAAFVDDQPIAFLWLTISGTTAFELYGGMNDLGQSLRANYALKWYAILKCKDWGLARYDFGGIIDGGVGTFKRNWAAGETDLAGSFDRPLLIFYGLWNRGLPTAKRIFRKISAKKR